MKRSGAGPALVVGGVDVGAQPEQRLHHLIALRGCRVVQRRRAILSRHIHYCYEIAIIFDGKTTVISWQ